MAESYEVVARVVSQNGTCDGGHKVGDEWIIGSKTPGGMCLSAFHSMFPALRVLRFGGSLPWEPDPDAATIDCPDTANPVVFELKRLRK